MSSPPDRNHWVSRTGTFLILAVLALPYFTALDDSSLWDANEAFYAQTPREMLERNDWVVPHFNGEPRVNKPPLSYWIVGFFYLVFEDSVFWQRLPMALLAFGCVLLVYRIGNLLFNPAVALWGAGIFALTFRFLILSRRLFIDVLLLFCLLAAIAFLLSALRDRKEGRLPLSALFFGLGFLTKGPVALLPLGFLLPWLLLTGRLRGLRALPLAAAGAVFLAVSSSWFVLLAFQWGPEAVADFLLRENLGRFSHLDFGPQRGPFYYVGVFFTDFFPWSLLFPAALLWWLRRGRHAGGVGGNVRQEVLLLLLWIGFYFLFFSLSLNKQEYYILPLYPASALLIGLYLETARPGPWATAPAAVLFAVAASLMVLVASQLLPAPTLWWLPLVPALLFGAALVSRSTAGTLICPALFYALAFSLYLEPFEQYKPVRPLAQEILRKTSENDCGDFLAGYYGITAPSLTFYLDRPVLQLYDQEEALEYLRSEPRLFLIVEQDRLEELRPDPGQPLEIVAVRPRIYTTGRTFVEALRSGRFQDLRQNSTRCVYLVSNRKACPSLPDRPGL